MEHNKGTLLALKRNTCCESGEVFFGPFFFEKSTCKRIFNKEPSSRPSSKSSIFLVFFLSKFRNKTSLIVS